MMLYVDSSAFAKRYIADEASHDECIEIMERAEQWATSRLTLMEAVRALRAAHPSRLDVMNYVNDLGDDLSETLLVDIDRATLTMAREIVLDTTARTLDAIHIASALRLQHERPRFLTFDKQQARAAEQMGLTLAR